MLRNSLFYDQKLNCLENNLKDRLKKRSSDLISPQSVTLSFVCVRAHACTLFCLVSGISGHSSGSVKGSLVSSQLWGDLPQLTLVLAVCLLQEHLRSTNPSCPL